MRILPVIALIGLMVGCERSTGDQRAQKTSGDPQTSSARIEATNAPTTAPAERAPAVLVIDQKPVSFPPAVLRTRVHDGQLIAVLMSDDPKDAVDDNYHGNSFYLEMPMDGAEMKDLPGFVYRYVAPTNERSDSLNGIFLDGNRQQLQPLRIQVKFEGAEPTMSVSISGHFLQVDTKDETVPTREAQVTARLEAEVKKK